MGYIFLLSLPTAFLTFAACLMAHLVAWTAPSRRELFVISLLACLSFGLVLGPWVYRAKGLAGMCTLHFWFAISLALVWFVLLRYGRRGLLDRASLWRYLAPTSVLLYGLLWMLVPYGSE